MDYHHYYNICFAETGIEEVFKKGQPEDEELRNLAYDFVIDLKSLCEMLDLTDLPLEEIYATGREENQIYAVLAKWNGSRESVPRYYNAIVIDTMNKIHRERTDELSIASYQTLAQLLDDRRIERHDLVERYCHDNSK